MTKPGGSRADDYVVGDLYGELWLASNEPAPQRDTRIARILPGLAVTGTAAIAASWISEHYGMPAVLTGLLIGLALNFVSADQRTKPGFEICSTTFLRWGIVLLGLQITLMQVSELGWVSFSALLAIMALVLGAGYLAARISGQGSYIGLLAGGATAICGASAALAIFAVIGKDRLPHHKFTFTLVGITVSSAVALSTYPVLAQTLGFTDKQSGFLMGAAIHDVAQSLGAGFGISPAAGETATIVKLTRVALLAPIVALIGFMVGQAGEEGERRSIWKNLRFPWFIVTFFIVVAVNSMITLPEDLRAYGLAVSKTLLLLAVIATAMNSRLSALLSEGPRGLIPVAAATLTSFAATALFAYYFL